MHLTRAIDALKALELPLRRIVLEGGSDDLARRAVGGDRAAFSALMTAHKQPIYRFARRRASDVGVSPRAWAPHQRRLHMSVRKLTALGAAVAALAAAGCAYAPAPSSEMKMSGAEGGMMHSCMSMSHDDMMKNQGCADMMKKMNMSEADMSKMMSCMKMQKDAMMKDQDCAAMMEKHSAMMKMDMPH